MTNLITEARELCEKATEGPWKVVDGKSFGVQSENKNIASCFRRENEVFIARSRTLIPELCDALEKAEEQNKQLMHELCKLACESVEREKNLARLEAEVMAACNSVRWVPVAERLPEERQHENGEPIEFNVIISGAKVPTTLCFDGAEWRDFWKDGGYGPAYAVTHWMPIPAPPEEGAEHERD